jgi:anti-sigma factor RsiW
LGGFRLGPQEKIVLGAPDFLTYGVLMDKEQISSGSRTAMECQTVQAQLSAWLDDELSEAAGAMLTAHLERCEVCRREWRKLMALDAALSNLAAPAPMGLAEKVAAQVRRPRRRSGWQSAALAACLVLGIALGGTMARSFYGSAAADATGAEVASLEDFHDFPQGSLGAVVASYQPEEGNGNLQ